MRRKGRTKDKKQEIVYKECLEFALFGATLFVEVGSLKTAFKMNM